MQIKAVVVGYGDRGSVYADYAIKNSEELKIEAVVDPDVFRLKLAKEKFNLDDEQCLSNFEDLIAKGKIADFAIVATMDQLHYEQSKALLLQDYHLLLEKPIVNNSKELQELKSIAEARRRIIMVGHVLRYTPFYGAIKQAILDGVVGDIMHMETSELVGISHSSSSYIRGKWNKESVCGSGMLLAKCCHDIDLICWLNNQTMPVEVVSYGGRNFILPENAPKDSTERCYLGCPHIDTCQFSAKSLYVDNDWFPHYSFPLIKKKHDEITLEEKLEALKTNDPMGVCAYKTGSDLVDHQGVMLKFKNGSTAFHSMISAVPRAGRKIHIIGTKGEIEGFFESNKFVVRKFDFKTSGYTQEEIDVSKSVDRNVSHGGGDIGLIRDMVKRMQGEKASIAATDIIDSVNGHECVYAAERSRKENVLVKVN
ncbi:MAG: gfo/Idh/MocA family oxidoreductase [Bacillota bacterium]|nr:MAG: gfo/Idh/MocA family oxidoreductase [Bacillota bacterium]